MRGRPKKAHYIKKGAIGAAVLDDIAGVDKNLLVKLTSGGMPAVLNLFLPTDTQGKINEALKHCEDDDLIQSIVETKVDFYASGFAFQIKPDNKNYKNRMVDRVDDMAREHDFNLLAENLVRDYVACDNAVLQWAVEGGDLVYVQALSPARCKFSNALGKERLELTLSQETVTEINAAITKDPKNAARLYPQKYIDAVRKGTNVVELKNEDGEYWTIKSKARKFTGFAVPSMATVFWDILMRKLLTYGDFSAAYFCRVIEQITAGESIPSGPRAGTKQNYVTKKELDALQKLFKDQSRLLRIFVNHTVKVSHSVPDTKIFDPNKYLKVEERILRWGGVADVLMTGKGEGFSQAIIGVRRFVSQGQRVRQTIGQMFEKFILHDSIRGIAKIPTNATAIATWDEQNMKDPKQVLDELNAIWDRGMGDTETYLGRLGYPRDMVKYNKEIDAKEKELWVPTFEPRQGLLNAAGRPAEETTPSVEPSRKRAATTKGAE